NKAMKMQLKAEDGSSWMQDSDAAGTVLWNGTVEDSKTQEVEIPTSANGVQVSVGNALATKVSLNGKSVDLQSNNASVWHLNMNFTLYKRRIKFIINFPTQLHLFRMISIPVFMLVLSISPDWGVLSFGGTTLPVAYLVAAILFIGA